MKDVSLQIFDISNENSVTQRGSFPLSGKTKEVVAYEWFRKIKSEMPFGAELEKVIADGDNNTEKVKEIEKAQLG